MITEEDRGRLAQFVGRYGVKHVRVYPHPIERVWRAVTEPRSLAAWYVPQWTIVPRLGGAWSCSYANPSLEAMEGYDQGFGHGVITAWEPPRMVDYGGQHRFELEEVADGTRMTWIQNFDPALRFPKLEATLPDGNPGGPGYPMFPGGQAGNHMAADDLADFLDGRPIDDGAGSDHWVELTKVYHAHFLASMPPA